MTTRARATAYTPALHLPAGQIARVLTVYSDNHPSLLISKAGAEAWAKSVVGQYITLSNNRGHGCTVINKLPSRSHAVYGSRAHYARILDYRLEDFPAHPGVGRVLAICERC